ncbi:MAG: hypothetical protein J6K89_08610, partial [Oscillospiraceae bacterium]|nr:hypothetical protein [Oscillospiraceae bacterium]
MTSNKLLQLVRMLTHSDFEDDILLMWLSNCENSILTEVMRISEEDCKPIEAVSDEPLLVPHPYDKLYVPYLQAQIHHAFGETDKYENFMALYNAYRDEYARKVIAEIDPAYGEAIRKGYYLTAYGIARSHGYSGTEEQWLRSLQGLTPNLTIGEVKTLGNQDLAEATITGTRENPVLNLGLPMGSQGMAGAAELGIAYGTMDAAGNYSAEGDGLPEVEPGSMGTHIGKGRQVVFVPSATNLENPTLSVNGSEQIPIRMRTSVQEENLTIPVPTGALMHGVPYTLTFCGLYWLLDSMLSLSETSRDLDAALQAYSDGDTVGLPVMDPDSETGFSPMLLDRGKDEEGPFSVPTTARLAELLEGFKSGGLDF